MIGGEEKAEEEKGDEEVGHCFWSLRFENWELGNEKGEHRFLNGLKGVYVSVKE